MLRFLLLACLLALSAAFMAPVTPSKLTMSKIVMNDTPGVKANFQGGSFQDYLDAQKKKKEEEEKKKKKEEETKTHHNRNKKTITERNHYKKKMK